MYNCVNYQRNNSTVELKAMLIHDPCVGGLLSKAQLKSNALRCFSMVMYRPPSFDCLSDPPGGLGGDSRVSPRVVPDV